MSDPHTFASENADRFLAQLDEFLRIPSVSADRTHHAHDVRLAANWLVEDLQTIGVQHIEQIVIDDHHPIVYGEWMGAGDNAPTVLIYGHYDVQPAEMKDGWDTPPFEPTIIDGKIYARGASDDKGQMLAQVKAAEALIQSGRCPVNLKFLLEGEEEVSSGGLQKFVDRERDKLSADVCVISDTAILSKDQPSIVYALRGITYFEMEVFGPTSDLHSGTYGGVVHNPVQGITEIIGALHNPDGSVNVPGFYDDVVTLGDDEREKLAQLGIDEARIKSLTGVDVVWGEPDYTVVERTGARPTLEIHGIEGGFYGEGSKTVLPAKAKAKISCRLVANQDPKTIYKLVKSHIESITPPTLRVEIRQVGSDGYPVLVDINDPALKAAAAAYELGWGKVPLYMRGGGSIPIVADFQNKLNIPVILLGFGLNTDGLHGPNEHFHIEMFHKGIDTAIHFLEQVAMQV